jgi:MGT family glycosyltransferase
VTPQRFILCTTPAQGHTAPLLSVSRQLVAEGHEVVFFTTEHYRDKVEATGARLAPFDPEYDAHDLMVANPERETADRRGTRGVKDDLRRIFVGPLTGQFHGLVQIMTTFPAEVIVVDTMFFGALPYALGRRADRPALACIGVMPFPALSRDCAPFGSAMQPGSGPIFRARNRILNVIAGYVVLRDINRLAIECLAACGAPPFSGSIMDLQQKVVDAYLQAGAASFEYSRTDLCQTVQFVGPVLDPPTSAFDPPEWWGELTGTRPVVHVTQGTLDNADLGRLLLPTLRALADLDLLVVATTGGPDPEPLRRDLPPNARIERFIPHHLLLPHVNVMVTNGGYGGVQQALANGVPLVMAGDSEDKPEVAARVHWAGVGVNLHTSTPSPKKIEKAVTRILADPTYARRAKSIQDEIAASTPVETIARTLVAMAETGIPSSD